MDKKAQSLTAAIEYWAQRLQAYYRNLDSQKALNIIQAATVHFMSQNSEQVWGIAQNLAAREGLQPQPRQPQTQTPQSSVRALTPKGQPMTQERKDYLLKITEQGDKRINMTTEEMQQLHLGQSFDWT
jgi:hypothetical protein